MIGPVMFLMYIDGLAKLLEHHGIIAKLFADDVQIYLLIKNDSMCDIMLTCYSQVPKAFDHPSYASVLYRFRDITSYLLKVADFDPPHLHLVPP